MEIRGKTKTAPTLASVVRTAVSQATGEPITGALQHGINRNHASIQSCPGEALVRRAQVSVNNTNTTSPGFYHPMTQPWAFQIPHNRKEIYLWAQWWRDNEPKVAAGIEFYTDFPLSGFELECSNSYVKDYFEELVKKLNFSKWLPLISQEYHLRGDVFIMVSINCPHCGGSNVNEETQEVCQHEGATWDNISILNPDMVDVTPHFLNQEPIYFMLPTEEMVRVVQEQQPKEIYDHIQPQARNMILARQPMKLDPISIHHLKRGAAPWQPFGTSLVRSLFPTLAYKDKLRQAQWLVAERHIVPIKLVKIGSDDHPASDEDIQSTRDELTNVATDPLLTLVTHHDFEMDFIGASGKVLQVTPEYELIDQEIIDGLMLNKAIINGDGPSYSNAQVGLITMAKRLEKFRQEVAYWIEECVFKPIAMWNGFSVEGQRGQEEFVYPTIKWDDLQLRDDSSKLQMMVQAQQQGVISAETLIEAFGLDYDQEVERLRYEQAANFINSDDVTGGGGGGGMGTGFRGPIGGGGGAPPPAGGPPGGAPDAAGGVPGLDAAAGGMPGAAQASVDNPEEAYRYATHIAKRIYDNHNTQRLTRIASKKVLSDLHKGYLDSIRPVTGRGYDTELLPEKMGEIFPLDQGSPFDGGPNCMPINRTAAVEWHQLQSVLEERSIRTAAPNNNVTNNVTNHVTNNNTKGKQNAPRQLFTRLEQKLYNLILSVNIPYAFYAQYQAGPSQQYQLDGAFPALKLGVEADSTTFHDSPDKIARDRRRDMELASQGWTVLRFKENELNESGQDVVNVIFSTIRALTGGSGGADKTVI